MKKFNDFLIKYMGEKNVQVNTMAKAIGKSRQTVINWRKGKYNPSSAEVVIDCANYMRLSRQEIDEFLKAAGFEARVEPFIKNLFSELQRHRVILLLTQADSSEPPYDEIPDTLLAYAKNEYDKNNILHIKPPTDSVDIKTYFSRLEKRCRSDKLDNHDNFEYPLKDRLTQNRQIFLLVSSFEQGSESLRQKLADSIYNASENNQFLNVIIRGNGEKLTDIKYKMGNSMPLLKKAEIKYWPEIQRKQVYALVNNYFNDFPLPLNDKLVEQFLAISGYHPKLLLKCLEFLEQDPNFNLPLDKYPQKLSELPYIYEWFIPFTQDESIKQQVYQLLQRENLGKAEPYIQNNLLRQLYWKNLLVEREIKGDKYLCWRCEAIQKGGERICGNGNK